MGDSATWETIRDLQRSLPKAPPNTVRVSPNTYAALRDLLPEVAQRHMLAQKEIASLIGFQIEADPLVTDRIAVFGWRLPNGCFEIDKIVVLTGKQ